MSKDSTAKPVALLLALLVAAPAVAQEPAASPVSRFGPAEAQASGEPAEAMPQSQEPQASVQPGVEPKRLKKLLKKDVSVYLHDGRVYHGRLAEVTEASMVVEVAPSWDPQRKAFDYPRETIPLAEVASIWAPGAAKSWRFRGWQVALLSGVLYFVGLLWSLSNLE